MKTVMAVLVVLPALMASALPARAQSAGAATLKPVLSLRTQFPCGDRRPIQPLNGGSERMPYGPDVPCPDLPGPRNPGPEPLPYPKPHPRPWTDDDATQSYRKDIEKSVSVLNGVKAVERAAVLATMFDGTVGGSSDGGVVLAGQGPAPADEGVSGIVHEPSRPAGYRLNPSKGAKLIMVGEKGAAAGAIAGGAAGELVGGPGGASLGAGVGGLAGSKAEDGFNSWIDKKGDQAIADGEKKLQEGTQKQRDAEQQFKNNH